MTESEKQKYKIIIPNRKVERQLDAVPNPDYARVSQKIQSLSENPSPYGAIKLSDKVHRIRIGDFRVVYSIFDKERAIVIDKVDRRKERTYKDY